MGRPLVVVFPEFAEQDLAWIQDLRRQYDALSMAAIDPHFTLVRPREGIEADALAQALPGRLTGVRPFEFILREARVVAPTDESDYSYVFLIPDEGSEEFFRLHRQIGSGAFIPHITICRSLRLAHCEKLADELNSRGIEVRGKVTALDIVVEDGARLAKVHRHILGDSKPSDSRGREQPADVIL